MEDAGSWDNTHVTAITRSRAHGVTVKFTQDNIDQCLDAVMGMTFHQHGEWSKVVRLLIPEKDRVYTAAGVTITVRKIRVNHLARPRSSSIQLKDGSIEMSYHGVGAAFKIGVSIAFAGILGYGKFEYNTEISTHVDHMDFTALLLPEFMETGKIPRARPAFSPFGKGGSKWGEEEDTQQSLPPTSPTSHYPPPIREDFAEQYQHQHQRDGDRATSPPTSDRQFYAHVKDVKLDFGGKLEVSMEPLESSSESPESPSSSSSSSTLTTGLVNLSLRVFDRWFRFIFRPALRQVLIYVLKWQGPAAIQEAFRDIVQLTKESADQAAQTYYQLPVSLVDNVEFQRPVIAIRGESVYWAFDVVLRQPLQDPPMSQQDFDLWYRSRLPRHWNHGRGDGDGDGGSGGGGGGMDKPVDFWNDPATPKQNRLWNLFRRRQRSCQRDSKQCKDTQRDQEEWLRAKAVASRQDGGEEVAVDPSSITVNPVRKSLGDRWLTCWNGICQRKGEASERRRNQRDALTSSSLLPKWKSTATTTTTTTTTDSFWQRFKSWWWPGRTWQRLQEWFRRKSGTKPEDTVPPSNGDGFVGEMPDSPRSFSSAMDNDGSESIVDGFQSARSSLDSSDLDENENAVDQAVAEPTTSPSRPPLANRRKWLFLRAHGGDDQGGDSASMVSTSPSLLHAGT